MRIRLPSLATLRAAALTVLLLAPALEAAAYRVELNANWNPTAACTPTTCIDAVTPTVEVWLDTEGAADIVLLSFGVSFTEPGLAFVPAASSTVSYLFYTTAKLPYLQRVGVCCEFAPGRTDVVDFGYTTTQIGQGVPTGGRAQLGTLVFDAVLPLGGPPLVDGVFDLSLGHVLQLGDGSTPPLDFQVTYAIPEPAPGALVGLGLVALSLVHGRRRRGRARRRGPV